MDERLGAFLLRVLKCIPEQYVRASQISDIYRKMYPPPALVRVLDKMRRGAFEEKEQPLEPIDLNQPIGYLARNGYVDHKLADFLMNDETEEVSLYRLSNMGRSYLMSLKSSKNRP